MHHEVLRRIEVTKNEELGYLDLSGLELTEIPTEILEVPWIGALSLSRNKIVDISMLSKMKQLHKLALTDNEIEEISVLGDMPKLRFIFLADNKIKDISKIKGQERLKKLVLANNNISVVPDLSQFPLLVYLDLSGNHVDKTIVDRLKRTLPVLKILKI
ncbi:MAG TPA: hypothetical protein ENK66_00575 [Arcobacter sp.]|nr:hypothetical protein [Arcobacter sp.]